MERVCTNLDASRDESCEEAGQHFLGGHRLFGSPDLDAHVAQHRLAQERVAAARGVDQAVVVEVSHGWARTYLFDLALPHDTSGYRFKDKDPRILVASDDLDSAITIQIGHGDMAGVRRSVEINVPPLQPSPEQEPGAQTQQERDND